VVGQGRKGEDLLEPVTAYMVVASVSNSANLRGEPSRSSTSTSTLFSALRNWCIVVSDIFRRIFEYNR